MTTVAHRARRITFTALFAALVAAGTFIRIPMVPLPIVLATMFVLLAPMVLGKNWGALSIAVYLLAGLAGLPIFSQGGGPSALFGYTGGYLFGYLAAAYAVGWIIEKTEGSLTGSIIAAVAGSLIIYAIGVPWLKFSIEGYTWTKAIMGGMVPFLIGDALKAAAAVAVFQVLKKEVPQFLESLPKKETAGKCCCGQDNCC